MLYPTGCPVRLFLHLAGSHEIVSISGNREKSLFACLTPQSLLIFQAQPQLVLCSVTRPEEDILEKGVNVDVVWRHDSSGVCITTSKHCLLVYRIQSYGKEQCYFLRERDSQLCRSSSELFLKDHRPKISVALAVIVRLSSRATCVVPLREELLVCLQDGWLHRLLWNGTVLDEYSVHLTKIPFSHDQLQSKTEYVITVGVHITHASYSPLVGGFSLVLSDGRAALLTSPSPKYHPSQLLGVWAIGLDDACCTSMNHKYRLLAFGCGNSEVTAYHLDETTGALIQAYRVRLAVKDNPELVSNLGPVRTIAWYPYGSALMASWWSSSRDFPVLGLLSVFGAQLWCSVDCDQLIDDAFVRRPWNCLDWGPEGFHLWIGGPLGLSLLSFVRSFGVNNPAMDHQNHVCLMGTDSVYLSPARKLEQSASAPHSAWNQLQVPYDYLAEAWPLRFCCVESGPKRTTLCVAGSRGLARCNLQTKKWTLFGNESQEREMVVTGGLVLWNGFVVAACYDIEKEQDDLRFYPLHRQLDNLYSTRYLAECQILCMNLNEDVLVTFDLEARIFIYLLKVLPDSEQPTVDVLRCAEIRTSDLVPHPACLISLQLTALKHDSTAAEFIHGMDTLLVNVSGRLVMLSPLKTSDNGAKAEPSSLQQPLLVASYIERMWHDGEATIDTTEPHLCQALWLQCGVRGMKVWMPLFRGRSGSIASMESSRSFISKRIMLPFELGIYPLVISSRDCLALGVESVAQTPVGSSRLDPCFHGPTNHVHRNSEVFLHHILRQLLKRNLGLYALEIAGTCRHLPYFGHVLELLLHEVLEEEATSSEAIPDPLLPRVVEFSKEFPEFLQTVAHCARKTELALWPQLFDTVGNPKHLFETCLRDGQLDTAASFLIVLQNMEATADSKKHATQLLEASIKQRQFTITRDIVRFLKAIDPADIDSPPRTPLYQAKQIAANPRISMVSPHAEADTFVFQTPGVVNRTRHHSTTGSPTDGKPVLVKTGSGGTLKAAKKSVTKTSSIESGGKTSGSIPIEENPVHIYLNIILTQHARELLAAYKLRDLGCFSAHLDFHLVLWLSRERSREARIGDFPTALIRLHTDFQWPYPLLSHTVVEHLTSKMSQMNLTNGDQQTSLKPLKIITRRNSMDSGLPALDRNVSQDNTRYKHHNKGLKEPKTLSLARDEPDDTRRLLMKQQTVIQSPELEKALLLPKGQDSNSVAGGTEMTEDSWMSPVTSSPSFDADSISNELDWEGLEHLCGEAAARGSQRAEAELRFLQQLMLESACLEWSLLICLILRDLVGLARAVNASSLAQAPDDTLTRLKNAVQQLDDWADHNCLGYKPLLHAAQKHIEALDTSATTIETNGIDDIETIDISLANFTPKTQTNAVPVSNSTNTNRKQANASSKDRQPIVPDHSSWKKGSADNIHVDIVSAISPSSEDTRSCTLM